MFRSNVFLAAKGVKEQRVLRGKDVLGRLHPVGHWYLFLQVLRVRIPVPVVGVVMA